MLRIASLLGALALGRSCAAPPGLPAAPLAPVALELGSLPSVGRVGDFEVRVREPGDPERRALAGSGGPVLVVEVSGRGRALAALEVQALEARAFADPRGEPPALETLSKTGVGDAVRCRYEPRGDAYCGVRCEDLEASPEGGWILRGEPRVFARCEGSPWVRRISRARRGTPGGASANRRAPSSSARSAG